MNGLLDGKVVLVTGGGKGLGAGIARRMAREGARIVIAELDAEAGEQTAAAIAHDCGVETLAVQTDISDKAQVEAVVAAAVDRFGGLDTLVNNAAMLSPNILMEAKSDEMLARTLGVALWGSWWGMRAAMPHMRARGGGAVVNFYSIDAETGAWLHADYNIAKSAILGLTRSAAVEWGRFNIRVNAIAPTGLGTVFAELVRDVPGFLEMATATNPLGWAGDPENDIGPAVVFLASEMSRFVTGEMIHVDGGQNLPGYSSKPADLAAVEALS